MITPVSAWPGTFAGRIRPLAHLSQNPASLVGREVFVYRNLHQDVWSIRAERGPDKGRVVGHAERLEMADARFVVQEGGRRRVLRLRQKNIHAGIRGRLTAVGNQAGKSFRQPQSATPVFYNPYKGPFFVDGRTQTPLASAQRVLMDIRSATPVLAQAVEAHPSAEASPTPQRQSAGKQSPAGVKRLVPEPSPVRTGGRPHPDPRQSNPGCSGKSWPGPR